MTKFAICGIDTGVGKTVVTGLFARYLQQSGHRVMTMKLVQTGCQGPAEDLLVHRQMMGLDWQPVDKTGLTCPYTFPFPGSPHLAAALAEQRIEPSHLTTAIETLSQDYQPLVIEGAGGLLVPLTSTCLQLDFLAQQGCQIILVTCPRLGSINHTLLSLEAMKKRGVLLAGVVYNLFGGEASPIIDDSRHLFCQALAGYPGAVPLIDLGPEPSVDDDKTAWENLLSR